MKANEKLSATARAARARESTKQAIGRELLSAAVFARIWPSYVLTREPRTPSEKKWGVWWILAVNSPAGWLMWRLSEEERDLFDWVNHQPWKGEKLQDRTPILLALATDESWTR